MLVEDFIISAKTFIKFIQSYLSWQVKGMAELMRRAKNMQPHFKHVHVFSLIT